MQKTETKNGIANGVQFSTSPLTFPKGGPTPGKIYIFETGQEREKSLRVCRELVGKQKSCRWRTIEPHLLEWKTNNSKMQQNICDYITNMVDW